MLGVNPAIEGGEAPTLEGALRKLLIATSEMLHLFMPKLGSHQRNIHGGGKSRPILLLTALLTLRRRLRRGPHQPGPPESYLRSKTMRLVVYQ